MTPNYRRWYFAKNHILPLLVFSSLLVVQPVSAESGSTGAGDGGHAVKCLTATFRYFESRIYSLDLFEALYMRQIESNFGMGSQPQTDYRIKVDKQVITNEMKIAYEILTERAGEILGPKHPFLQSISAFYATEIDIHVTNFIPKTDDIGTLTPEFYFTNCKMIQIAKRVRTPQGWKFYFDKNDWRFMAGDDRIGVLIHEILHSWFAPYNSDTRAVRQAVIFLSAPPEQRRLHSEEFRKIIESRKPVFGGFVAPKSRWQFQ